MRNFIKITLISLVLMLAITLLKLPTEVSHIYLPQWLQNLHQDLLNEFQHRQNANFVFSMLTGQKKGLSGRLIKDLQSLNLIFLLSPGGIHLAGFLFFIKKGKVRLPIFLACWLLPNFYSLKRLALLRFLYLFKKHLKKVNLFYLTFIISFLAGHFSQSPIGFSFSFLLIGTFFSVNDESRFKIFLALAASHLLLAFFLGNNFSFIGLVFSLILVQLFRMLLPLFILYLFSFLIFPSHWIEPIIRLYILLIHYAAKFSNGTFLTSSFMLLCLIWIILLNKNKWWIVLCLLLHAELSQAPSIFLEGLRPVRPSMFARK